MSVAVRPLFAFDSTFVRDLPGLYEPWSPAVVPAPRLLALNEPLARELGAEPEALRTRAGVAVLVGNVVPEGAQPVAQAYSGHQFGGFSPRLGDGRALLLGEVIDVHGHRRDLHMKGTGRTAFARGGDGKAAVGPMLREYVMGEAMHALGIPTTRSLAVVATGEKVRRETALPGAVLTRVAASHLRVGTFEYAALVRDPGLAQRLADYAIARHHPGAAAAERPYLALLEAVAAVQADLVARWMLVGFVHGVMNTDNTTISGETIDYGPCAFLDAYDHSAVFSSIDHGARYAYGQQPAMAQWNLARLAEALLPLIDDDQQGAIDAATTVLRAFMDRYHGRFAQGMAAKLGLAEDPGDDGALVAEVLGLMQAQGVDFTSFFRALAATVRGARPGARDLFTDRAPFDAWAHRWQAELDRGDRDPEAVAAAMDRVNPLYIPRNHLVEEALAAATAGDMTPFDRLLEAVTAPFDERPGRERYAEPAPDSFGRYVTYCGT